MSDFFVSAISGLNRYYPVGSIYMTVNGNFNPAESFGGLWERISGRILIGCGGSSGIKNGDTDGAWDNTITIDNLPKHKHEVNVRSQPNIANIAFIQNRDGKSAGWVNGWADFAYTRTSDANDNYLPADWDFPYARGGSSSLTEPPAKAESTALTTQTGLTEGYHNHNLSGNTYSEGTGTALTIKPPYLGVNIWKRIG